MLDQKIYMIKVIKLILHPLRKNNSELTKTLFKGSTVLSTKLQSVHCLIQYLYIALKQTLSLTNLPSPHKFVL